MSGDTSGKEPVRDRPRLAIAAILGLLGATCAGLGLPALVYLFTPPRSKSESGWADIGDLRDFEPGVPRTVSFQHTRHDGWLITSERVTAWVVKDGEGKITAFSPRCTHLGCAFGWDDARREFVCPCHDSRFEIDGRRKFGPAPRGLDRHEVRRAGNRVWLATTARREADHS